MKSPVTPTGLPRGQRDRIRALKNSGTATVARSQFNFIEGANVTLTVSDNATSDRVDITIASTGGASLTEDQAILASQIFGG